MNEQNLIRTIMKNLPAADGIKYCEISEHEDQFFISFKDKYYSIRVIEEKIG